MVTKKAVTSTGSKRKTPAPTKPAVKKSSASKAGQEVASEEAQMAIPEESLLDVVALEDRWFSPKSIATILGVDEKWINNVREGLKGVDGPPYKKLGTGKSAPIRYNYGLFKEWLDSFPHQINTHGKLYSRFASANQFFSSTDTEGSWLFAQQGDELVDIVTAINGGLFDGETEPELVWLNFWGWLQRASKTPSMAGVIATALASVRSQALSNYENALFESGAPPGKKVTRTRTDDPAPKGKTRGKGL